MSAEQLKEQLNEFQQSLSEVEDMIEQDGDDPSLQEARAVSQVHFFSLLQKK